jgi:hypothetical protein
MLGGSGESRRLPIRVILRGFFVADLPTDIVQFHLFPTAPLENVRKRLCDSLRSRTRRRSSTAAVVAQASCCEVP